MIRHLALFVAGCCLGALIVLIVRTARQHGAPQPILTMPATPVNSPTTDGHDHDMSAPTAPAMDATGQHHHGDK